MTANTKIEWADHTFNPWTGCTKVSPGCDHCYAESWAKRSGHVEWGPYKARRRTTESYWQQPRKWNAQAAAEGRRYRVFCASLADVFDNAVLFDWRLELFELIRATPHLDWLLLTKRIGNAAAMIEEVMRHIDIGHTPAFATWPWPNVWIGATMVNQEEIDRDLMRLVRTPAAKRFLSIEPMLGPITFAEAWIEESYPVNERPIERIDWVIAGGESGHSARPAHPDWFRTLQAECEAVGVPFFFKQWGEWVPRGPEEWGYPSVDGVPRIRLTDAGQDGSAMGEGGNDVWVNRAGKARSGRLLDGREYSQVPA